MIKNGAQQYFTYLHHVKMVSLQQKRRLNYLVINTRSPGLVPTMRPAIR